MDTQDIEYVLAAYALILQNGNQAEKEAARHLVAAMGKLKKKAALKKTNSPRLRSRPKSGNFHPIPDRQKADKMVLLAN